MKMTKSKTLLAALLLAVTSQAAQANTISLTPLTQVSGVGQRINFGISIDFLQSTVGGSMDIFYDSSVLDFVGFSLDKDFWANVADPVLGVMPDNCFDDGAALGGCEVGDAELNSFGFGNFDGIIGEHTVGSVTFVALTMGIATVQTAESDGPFGGFISAVDASQMTVVFNGASVLVVPLPAAIWLFGGAIGLLGALRRR